MGVIRLLLAASVVITHVHDPVLERFLIDGALAVKLFFVISGFYMALILNEKYVGPGALRLFYGNRLLRLLPLYYAMLLMALGLAGAGYALRGPGFVTPAVANWLAHGPELGAPALVGLALSNLLVVGQEYAFFGVFLLPGGHFALSDQLTGADRVPAFGFLLNPPAWTLALELGFYALAPWVVRRSSRTVLVWMAVPLLLRVVLERTLGHPFRWDHFLPTQLHLFLLGALAYRCLPVLRERLGTDRLRRWGRPVWGGLLGLLATGALWPPAWRQPLLLTLLAAGLPLVFLASAPLPLDRLLGELSFPLYIAHGNAISSVQWLFLRLAPLRQDGPLRSLAYLAVALLFGGLLYWCVDRPIDRFRQRRLRLAAVTGSTP
jgi:peptidoglycan/LPS O-acetylase OafA/YrhL